MYDELVHVDNKDTAVSAILNRENYAAFQLGYVATKLCSNTASVLHNEKNEYCLIIRKLVKILMNKDIT